MKPNERSERGNIDDSRELPGGSPDRYEPQSSRSAGPGGLRYHTIANDIRQRIASGVYTFGDALPSQATLAREFSTTVMTVRQALKVLESEGLIELRHGVGSFVTGLTGEHREFALSSFRRQMGERASEVETTVLSRNEGVVYIPAGQALGIGEAPVASIARLRTVRSVVLVYQVSYVPAEYAHVLAEYRPGSSLYANLNAYLNTVISRADERLSAIATPSEVAGHLGVAFGTPCLYSARVSKDAGGRPVLFDQAYMRSDRVELTLHRNGRNAFPTYIIHDEVVP